MPAVPRPAAQRSAKAVLVAVAALLALVSGPTAIATAQSDGHYVRGGEVQRLQHRIPVGTDIQSVVDRARPGSTFILEAGVHRGQRIVPRSGDTFVGEPGAVLSGAKVLDPGAFTRTGGAWRIGGQSQTTTTSGSYGCTDWNSGRDHYAQCGWEAAVYYGQELFGDGRRLRHVNALDLVDAPGEWWFDDAGDAIVMFDDPASFDLLETTVASYAFVGRGTDGVTIRDLAVRMYGSQAQHGAIDGRQSTNWTIEGVEVTNNHGSGITVGPGMSITYSRINDNGNTGMEGSGHDPVVLPITITHNEIARNTAVGYQHGWNSGGVKLAHTTGAVVANNWVHHNAGKGIWFDIVNDDATVRDNLVEANDTVGIFYEISNAARITGNTVRGNHTSGNVVRSFGNITIASSRDVEVDHNWVGGDGTQEIVAYHQDRGPGLHGLDVHHNLMVLNSPWGGGQAGVKDTGPGDAYADNRFRDNRYHLTGETHVQPFYWSGASLFRPEWEAATGDTRISDAAPPPPGTDGIGTPLDRFGPDRIGPTATR